MYKVSVNSAPSPIATPSATRWWVGRVAATLIAEFRRQWAVGSFKSARNFALRSILFPVVTARWVAGIHRLYAELNCAAPAGIVINKPLRNYLARGHSVRQRVDLLLNHYEIERRILPPDVRASLAGGEAVTLGVLSGNRGNYVLKLAGSRRMYTTHEGELVLYLEKASDACILAKLSFVFAWQPDGALTIVIGGFQGVLGGFKREVVDATRSLSNLRPKDVVFVGLNAMADRLGLKVIHAVGNDRHVIRAHRNHAIHSDYDAYWIEKGGQSAQPYGFTLPVELPRVATPANKRDSYKAGVISMMRTFLP